MASKHDQLKKELGALVLRGTLLYYAMAGKHTELPDSIKKVLRKHKEKLPSFDLEYETWYSEAMRVVKQILPDRVDDFVKQYKIEKRKEISCVTYGIADYCLGIVTRRLGEVIVDGSAAIPKMQIQVSILTAAEKSFESSLFDIQEVLQADLFDSELDAARELAKNGFCRAGGAVAGVVLEKHLAHVCEIHGIKSRKAHPSIVDYNQLLKKESVIDTRQWRFNQSLGDIRNLWIIPRTESRRRKMFLNSSKA